MDPISAIGQVGAIVEAARSVMNGLGIGSRRDDSDSSSSSVTSWQERLEHAVSQFVETRDGDDNGSLSATESGLNAKLFARLDRDGDGQLSKTELVEAFRREKQSAQDGGSLSILA